MSINKSQLGELVYSDFEPFVLAIWVEILHWFQSHEDHSSLEDASSKFTLGKLTINCNYYINFV